MSSFILDTDHVSLLQRGHPLVIERFSATPEDAIKEHPRLGKMDLRIAATTLAVGGTLVTPNTRDFKPIANLPLEDWTTG